MENQIKMIPDKIVKLNEFKEFNFGTADITYKFRGALYCFTILRNPLELEKLGIPIKFIVSDKSISFKGDTLKGERYPDEMLACGQYEKGDGQYEKGDYGVIHKHLCEVVDTARLELLEEEKPDGFYQTRGGGEIFVNSSLKEIKLFGKSEYCGKYDSDVAKKVLDKAIDNYFQGYRLNLE